MRLPVPAKRTGYRVAYRLLQAYWFVRRPQISGVKCVLTDREQVLLVRHSYGNRRWDLPGGAVKRGETPLAAAQREIAEELGVSIRDWTALGELRGREIHRRDELHCFRAEVREPSLTLDLGELLDASWFPSRQLPRQLARYVRPILGRAELEG